MSLVTRLKSLIIHNKAVSVIFFENLLKEIEFIYVHTSFNQI